LPPPVRPEGLHEPTQAGTVLGTPDYMAPEQAEGRLDRMDARTDVYGLGAILYHLLTGKAPFSGEDVLAVLARVCRERPRPLREVVAETPRALAAICLQALSKK